MTLTVAHLQPIVSLIAGVLILIRAAIIELYCRYFSDRIRRDRTHLIH
jgi:hypothetical protein